MNSNTVIMLPVTLSQFLFQYPSVACNHDNWHLFPSVADTLFPSVADTLFPSVAIISATIYCNSRAHIPVSCQSE